MSFAAIMDYLRAFSPATVIIRLILAAICGGRIGLEREKSGRAAGFRTHILVCLGAAMCTLTGHYLMTTLAGYSGDPMRIGAQVVSGIGFLGVGTILSKGRFQVTGLTTAAGLWSTAAIGLAVGIGFYEGALIGAGLIVVTMVILSRLDAHLFKCSNKLHAYMEIADSTKIGKMLDNLKEKYDATDLLITTARSGIPGHAGIEATIKIERNNTAKQLLQELQDCEEVLFAIQSI